MILSSLPLCAQWFGMTMKDGTRVDIVAPNEEIAPAGALVRQAGTRARGG